MSQPVQTLARTAEAPTTASSSGRRRRMPLHHRIWRERWMYVLILPGFVFFVVFAYIPLIGNVAAWQDYSPYLGFRASPWVGWQNFLNIFSDPELIRATQNTLLLSFLQLVFAFPAPLALALMLNSVLSERTRRTIQAIVYLPHFIGWVIVVSIWNEILGPLGVVNNLLESAGLGHADIIGNPGAFASLVTAQVIWKEVGWGRSSSWRRCSRFRASSMNQLRWTAPARGAASGT